MHASRFRWVGSSKSPICWLYICFKQQMKKKQDHYHTNKEAKMGSFMKNYLKERTSTLVIELFPVRHMLLLI